MRTCLNKVGLARVWKNIKNKFATIDTVNALEERLENFKAYPAGGSKSALLSYKNDAELQWVTTLCSADVEDGEVVLKQRLYNLDGSRVSETGASVFPVAGEASPGVLTVEDYNRFNEVIERVETLENEDRFPEATDVGDLLVKGPGSNNWGKLLPAISATSEKVFVGINSLVENTQGNLTVVGTFGRVEMPNVSAQNCGVLTPADYKKLNNAASKSDLVGLYCFKGSVEVEGDLPANASNGDVYNIVASSSYGGPGTNVAWSVDLDGWDALGGYFVMEALTDDEIDAVCV